ncbi:hypothetical protein B0H19DRAFT_1258508 [Mycena capillaripes]|nr:hypothetical protein B0H19DRAFT_1258508 [Mycena capillaripes]
MAEAQLWASGAALSAFARQEAVPKIVDAFASVHCRTRPVEPAREEEPAYEAAALGHLETVLGSNGAAAKMALLRRTQSYLLGGDEERRSMRW